MSLLLTQKHPSALAAKLQAIGSPKRGNTHNCNTCEHHHYHYRAD